MKNKFKGGNEYSQEVLADVQRDLVRAIKILQEMDHNFAFVDGCRLDVSVVRACTKLLLDVSQNLYEDDK